MKPLCIDLFCGLGGWTDGFLAEGYDVVGFDIEQHAYGSESYPPAQLVIQNVLTLHGSQFKDAACIVCSPPCQKYSYMAMPWKRAKAMAAEIRESTAKLLELNRLFWACLDIQEQASRAAGHRIPLVIENVKGAQPWVGPAKAHFGSFYLWGDVESVGGAIVAAQPVFGQTLRAARRSGQKFNPDGTEHPQGSWFKIANSVNRGAQKNSGGSWFNEAHNTESGKGQNPVTGVKVPAMNWSDRTRPAQGFNMEVIKREGVKQRGRLHGKNSDSRKAASAMIAKIPFELASYIARMYKPESVRLRA